MTSMRAVLIKDGKGPVENLYIGETPKPKPDAGQVLVKACFICFSLSTTVINDLAHVFSRSGPSVSIAWTYHKEKANIHLHRVHP
jgi:hypothetical protein